MVVGDIPQDLALRPRPVDLSLARDVRRHHALDDVLARRRRAVRAERNRALAADGRISVAEGVVLGIADCEDRQLRRTPHLREVRVVHRDRRAHQDRLPHLEPVLGKPREDARGDAAAKRMADQRQVRPSLGRHHRDLEREAPRLLVRRVDRKRPQDVVAVPRLELDVRLGEGVRDTLKNALVRLRGTQPPRDIPHRRRHYRHCHLVPFTSGSRARARTDLPAISISVMTISPPWAR